MGFRFTARCDACGHQIDVRDLDAMKGWMRGHYAHGCTLTERERAILECIAAVEDIRHVGTTTEYAGRFLPQRTVVLALRALLDKP